MSATSPRWAGVSARTIMMFAASATTPTSSCDATNWTYGSRSRSPSQPIGSAATRCSVIVLRLLVAGLRGGPGRALDRQVERLGRAVRLQVDDLGRSALRAHPGPP